MPQAADGPLLQVENLTVAYRDRLALRAVDLELGAGSMVAVAGPNGAGKSTLLKAILGLVPSLAGRVQVAGRPLRRRDGLVAYVPQRASLDWDFPISALEVATMGLYGRIGWLRPVRRRHRELARAQLERVGLAELADRPIGELSGGQQQRVLLARALAQDPRLYLLDEPFAGIDATSERVLLAILRQLRDQGRSILVVHHDLETVATWFDAVLLLNVERIAMGPLRSVLTAANLARAYGYRLEPGGFGAVSVGPDGASRPAVLADGSRP
ncbi:MAG: metal ABC transporter ATP-binding protein [Geminicoccaceae bacterium]|nr:metal ABC transporter ATP-binding protein [Geminicoccaceae bacterium]MCX8099811.1 metal ABC transporter ATP-binding protein [Geminicoccaceae bacterium]MDW8368769.1 metal ABC transporter ATP-binding protein [Geminicoccaceae bacterium]